MSQVEKLFFYRFSGMHLAPGNKASGFVFSLESQAFLQLAAIEFTPRQRELVLVSACQRIAHAQLVPKKALKALSIGYHAGSALPRWFVQDPMFGASLGANPEDFSRIERADALAWLGPETDYTPHNVDTPKQALALMLLAQAWTEAVGPLLYGEGQQSQAQPLA